MDMLNGQAFGAPSATLPMQSSMVEGQEWMKHAHRTHHAIVNAIENGQGSRAQALGADPFSEVQLADAAMALRQGVGRLIRRAGDRGLIVIGDVRLRRRAYGPALLAALPPSRWLDTEAEVDAWLGELAALTRASTTDRSTS